MIPAPSARFGMTTEYTLSKNGQGSVQTDGRVKRMNSVDRVRIALKEAGHLDTITGFSASTRTAADAAAAIGCTVAQIAKSIVFRSMDQPVLVIASGRNRVDLAKVEMALRLPVDRADPTWMREVTGFIVGAVPPVGHLMKPLTLIDQDLLVLDPIWAAAGSPTHVFRTTASALVTLSNGKVADVKQVSDRTN
jgi:prolyl-tRNA editing enzyme YbaK/EbsC (Cys-tRNA(Pro) deacylase)